MDWITLLSSLAALITAAAALLTVLEMKRQRTTLYRPDLTVPSAPLFVYSGSYSPIGNTVHCSIQRHKLPDEPPLELPLLELDCYNIGLGAAKNVQIAWNLDLKAILEVLNRVAQPHGKSVAQHELSNSMLLLPHVIPYVLPAQTLDVPARIRLPYEYIKAVTLYASYYVRPHDQEWAEVPPEARPALHVYPQSDESPTHALPPAILFVLYTDIGDNSHSRTYKVAPRFFRIQTLPRERDHIEEIGSGYLKVVPDAMAPPANLDQLANPKSVEPEWYAVRIPPPHR